MLSIRLSLKARVWAWRLAGPSLKRTVAACGPLLMRSVVRHFISPCLLGCINALHLRRAGKGRFLASGMSAHERPSRPLPDGHLPEFSKILPSKSNAESFGRSRRRPLRQSSGSVCIGSLAYEKAAGVGAALGCAQASCVLGEKAGALEADLCAGFLGRGSDSQKESSAGEHDCDFPHT
jgi:hypothetical protein